MSSLTISGIIFACIFGGALLGMLLRARLPGEHLSPDTKDVVKLVTGIASTMAAVVLGLLVATAKSSYDAQRSFVVQLAANIVMLDRTLAHYGSETHETRDLLRASVVELLQRTWPGEKPKAEQTEAKTGIQERYEALYDRIQELKPQNDAQRTRQVQALKIVSETGQSRLLLFAQQSSSIPTPYLVLMVCWLALIFVSFGLFAPRNGMALAALLLGALVVSSSMFLILELDHPFGGMIQIPSQPLRSALSQLGR
jgi:hypothetical protein